MAEALITVARERYSGYWGHGHEGEDSPSFLFLLPAGRGFALTYAATTMSFTIGLSEHELKSFQTVRQHKPFLSVSG